MGGGTIFTPALVTMAGQVPRRGRALEQVAVVPDGALAWDELGLITYAGPASGLPAGDLERTPADGTHAPGAILPGFVDAHTHLPFVGWRADEFEARLAGRTYRDLQGGGGGIYRSSRMLREASDDDVLAFCLPLLEEMARHGTTALELKTGYGLSVEDELRQARLARRLAERGPQTATVTLLACHAVPEGITREDWVERVRRELIPRAAEEALAETVDVYVEDIAFTVDDLRAVADAAQEHGLAVRCHADQLGASEAAQVTVEVGGRSADHLNHTDAGGVRALAGSDTVATVLPVSTLFLRAQPPPVTELLAAGAAVAVATDFNPGTSPCLSMPEVIAVAASLYRMPVAAALAAATVNASFALGLHDRLGTLEPGRRADFVVLDAPEAAMIPYRPGHDPVVQTWIGGVRIVPQA
jgi:imidazolonepropionase